MQKTKLPNVVLILVLTLITSIAWASFGIYRSLTAKPPEVVPKEISDPLTPTLDQNIISRVESGMFFSGSEIPNLSLTLPSGAPAPTTIPLPVTTPVASPSAVPSASPSAVPVI